MQVIKHQHPRWLYPGYSSESGFLREGEKLQDVIDQDKSTLLRLGISYEQVADCLEYVTKRAKQLGWLFSKEDKNPDVEIWDRIAEGFVVGRLSISWTSYMGYQECPFGCEGEAVKDITLADSEFHITNLDTKETIFCSELLPHLIRKHHFFEGHTKYRLDPAKAIRVLGIEKGVEYPLVYGTRSTWVSRGMTHIKNNTLDERKKDFCSSNERARIVTDGEFLELGKGIEAYLLGDKFVVFTDRGIHCNFKATIKGIPVDIFAYGGSWALFEISTFEYMKEWVNPETKPVKQEKQIKTTKPIKLTNWKPETHSERKELGLKGTWRKVASLPLTTTATYECQACKNEVSYTLELKKEKQDEIKLSCGKCGKKTNHHLLLVVEGQETGAPVLKG